MNPYKKYKGRVPACGIFCGGCPVYVREKMPCPGAEKNSERCNRCKSFHLCCIDRGITHCFECNTYPCAKLKRFAKNWLKYGQDMLKNQELLSQKGNIEFLKYFNSKVKS
jgi:hypothetical protein